METLIIIGIFLLVIIVMFNLNKNDKSKNVISESNNIPLPDFAKKNPNTGAIDLEFSFEDSIHEKGIFLVVDVETTGLPKRRDAQPEEINNWPRILQISWILFDLAGNKLNAEKCYLKQEKPIPIEATEINGIDDEIISKEGEEPIDVWNKFLKDVNNSEYVVAHNIDFDIPIIESEFIRNGFKKQFSRKKKLCTMKIGKNYCKIPSSYGSGYKYPKLEELFKDLFFPTAPFFHMTGLHDSWIDTCVTAKCFFKLFDEDMIKL